MDKRESAEKKKSKLAYLKYQGWLTPAFEDQLPEPDFFAVCDIEAHKWIQFLTIGFYDGDDFQHFEKLSEFFEYVFEQRRRREKKIVIYAHFGGGYDFLFLLNYLIFEEKYKVESIIPRGSSLLSFDVTVSGFPDEVVTFRDSSAMFPFSLAKLAENFGVKHQKLEIDYEGISVVNEELITYLMHDCMALWECIDKYASWHLIKEVGQTYTIAGQAMKILRLFLEKPIPPLHQKADEFVRSAYFGGRTEIFKPVFQASKKFPELHCYDVNSLYPTVMRENDFPGKLLGVSLIYQPEMMGFYEAMVEVPENHYIPPLGLVYTDTAKNSKFIFPTGTFSGVWSTIELEYARSKGVKIISTGKGLLFENAGPIFKKYVDTLYEIRENSPRDSVDNVLAKLLLNSCYGRFGLSRDREMIEIDSKADGSKPFMVLSHSTSKKQVTLSTVPKEVETFTNVAVAAWVTSLARIHMHKIYSKNPSAIYYTDTDSIFTTDTHEDRKGLGALKHEYSVKKACFLLPKTYMAGEKITMKGFDKRKVKEFKFDQFMKALEGDMKALQTTNPSRPARFRSAVMRGNILTLIDDAPRQVRTRYDKRIVQKSKEFLLDTKPIELGKGAFYFGAQYKDPDLRWEKKGSKFLLWDKKTQVAWIQKKKGEAVYYAEIERMPGGLPPGAHEAKTLNDARAWVIYLYGKLKRGQEDFA